MSIYRGTSHITVLQAKKKLAELGYHFSTLDELYDLDFEIAITDFQTQSPDRLTVDHILGPKTLASLKATKAIPNPPDKILTLLKVPYLSQRDNEFKPSGTCNITSLAMLMEYNGITPPPGMQLEDILFKALQTPFAQDYYAKTYPSFKNQGYNARNIHGMLSWLARQYNYKASFTTSGDMNTIQTQLMRNKQPVIVTGNFTRYGHIVLVTGLTLKNNFIVHDPWGDWNTHYQSHQGSYRLYDKEDMWEIMKGTNTNKWMHIINPE